MHSLNNRGVHSENLRVLPNYATSEMDYRQKMVVSSSQKLKHEDDDDEDLETLRLAALKSLRGKNTLQSTQQPALLPQPMKPKVAYSLGPVYNRGASKRGYYQNRTPRPNGNIYHPSRLNQNLIEIVPMEQDDSLQKDATQTDFKTLKSESHESRDDEGDSKFYRYKDTASGSEEEDTKESNSTSTAVLTPKSERLEKVGTEGDESGTEQANQSAIEESPREEGGDEDIAEEDELEEEEKEEEEKKEEEEAEEEEEEGEEDEEEEEEEEEEDEEEEEKPANDDDDDVLLMADLEEEDSLERLMDEMEREMNVQKPSERRDKKCTKKDVRESKKISDAPKPRNRKSRGERESDKNGSANAAVSTSSSLMSMKNERRSVSPRSVNRTLHKRRSLSPKLRLRKKSPRRSPRRSPPRQSKKLREMARLRSPRKLSPPSRFSPRPRSPKLSPRPRSPRLSPRRSPNNRSPMRRSPPRKMSPRGRSPHSRSPRIRRSRSPIAITRSRSPRPLRSPKRSRSPRPLRSPKRSNRSRSPRIIRSRSPRNSPVRLSPRARTPRSKSPRLSPLLRRASPRSRSPRLSPRRAASPRPRSPKLSPERRRGSPIRHRSPVRLSPHRSPWPSPKNSPRHSPRRRRSPKESTRKTRPRSITPEENASAVYKREASPVRKNVSSPDIVRSKAKQRDTTVASGGPKDSTDTTSNDPVLEARRRKFECNKPIDPIHDNKKIKLSKRDNGKKNVAVPEEPVPIDSPKAQRSSKILDEYEDVAESDLCLTDDYVYEVLEDVVSGESSPTNTVSMCVEMVPVKVEKERSKKKKKRDKEIYQVGKLKGGELTLSERIGKEKKCKKRKDRVTSPVDNSPEQATTVVEDLAVDEEGDLRTELSRRRAERLNRAVPIQSARLLQSAFKGVVNEVAKTNAKVIQRHSAKGEEKGNKKDVRRVTVLHRTVTDLPDSEEEAVVDSKVPVRFRLGINKSTQECREPKAARKSSKRQGRKVKHKNNMPLTDHDRKNQ